MDPALIGTRLATAAIGPLLKKLLVQEPPGAGLAGKAPVRLSRLVSFRGEKRTLTEADVRRLAAALVGGAVSGPGEPPFPADETEAVTDALARTLVALGDLDMDDVQAVRLGHRALARRLKEATGAPPAGLSTDSAYVLDTLTEWACLQILEFFTQRPSFVARTLVEQSRGQEATDAKVDELIRRVPRPDGRDVEFERRYLAYLAKKHGKLTIYGIDLHDSADRWPLDVAYLSLEATGVEAGRMGALLEAELRGPNLPVSFDPDLLFPRNDVATRADLALARHSKVLLRGLAGSGKTTLVQWLAVSAAREELPEDMAYLRDRVPFVLPLRALTRHGERLPAPDRFLEAVGCPLSPPEGWADRVLSVGRGLILIDGIDEIPEAERDRARRWLRDLLDTYDADNRWLVTSRPTAVRDDWLAEDGFAELTLSPMSTAEVTTFVQRWHRAAGPEAASYERPLLDALRTTPDVAALATNPLMCGLICALHRDRRGFLPRGRKALYEAALSMLLLRRDRERDMGNPYGIELGEPAQIQLIQRLAYWLTLNGRTQMDRSHAESVVRAAVPAIPEAAAHGDPDAVFTHLLHRSGLLREPTAGTVDFVHRTFQDYLAAKALVDQWDIGVLVDHAGDDQWEDVIRMAVAHARPRECAEIFGELLKAVDAAQGRPAKLRILVVAATALDHATEVAPEIRERVLARTAAVIPPQGREEARELASVGRTVLDLLPGPEGLDDETALNVVITATHVGDDAALPYLAKFVEHPALVVRSQLMWAWARFDTKRYAEEIITRLDPDGLYFTVQADEQAVELARIGMRPDNLDIRLVSEHGLDALSPLLGTARNLKVTAFGDWSSAVPADNEVRSLHLTIDDWLDVVRALPRLTSLSVLGSLNRTDWEPLAELEFLESLAIDAEAVDWCPPTRRLPRVQELHVRTETSPSCKRIAQIFPGLRRLRLMGDWRHPEAVHDLAPLAALESLEQVTIEYAKVTGVEHLPPTVQIVIQGS
ncbi:NACHT domain-containing protein [Streptomyces sp. NPDC048629]|uniref:NACHT domain-containing protein n=1 Tax=Streptomyces sp. NPDC048629 TaxID=3154824 RepID=UPI003446EB88